MRPSPSAEAGVGRGTEEDFEIYTRASWAASGRRNPDPPSESALGRDIAGGVTIAPDEVVDIYAPLCQLIAAAITARPISREMEAPPTGERTAAPFVIGIAGSVAVGKSTTARVIQAMLHRGEGHPAVEVLSTDSFLYPNRVLEDRGLTQRKGFPESYDVGGLLTTLDAIRAGESEVSVPVYSHESYDILRGEVRQIRRSGIVIVEGLNVLQPIARRGPGERSEPSDLFDFSIYLDAAEEDIARWFRYRLLAVRSTGSEQPGTFRQWLGSLSEEEILALAAQTWSEVNLVNLREHVAPTRRRANVILEYDLDHHVTRVLVRRH